MNKKITVAIVEDNTEIRKSLEILISGTTDFEFLGSYSNAEVAISDLPKKNPDVVLMDINLPGENGIVCVRKLKPILISTNFIILTMYDDSEKVFEALKSGASGYLLKRTPPSKLLESIKEVYLGGSPMSMQIARMVVKSFSNVPTKSEPSNTLTERENEILENLSRGMRYKEIADSLFISIDTVRTHIRKIYEKLQVHSKTEAILKYFNKPSI